MQRVVIEKPGGYDRLKIQTFPTPSPLDGEVLVDVYAAGVNYADVCVRWGVYESAKKFVGWPITPGFEFSGQVLAVGGGVKNFKVGDEVFGITRFNAYATHVVVNEEQIWLRPAKLTREQAAAFPAVFLTAYHALFQNVYLRPGMHVMIHSAGGGVGSALVQLAKISVMHVTGVVGSSHKVDYVKTLGVDAVIDKSTENLWAKAEAISPSGFDIILDANGPETLRESYKHLRPTGKLIAYGFHTMLPKHGGRIKYLKAAIGLLRIPKFNPLAMTSENKSLIAFNLSFLFDRTELLREGMSELLKWLDEGKVTPMKVTSFPLRDVAGAHRLIESGQSTGKIVLINSDRP